MYIIGQALEELFKRENWNYQKRSDRTYYFGFRGESNRFDFWAIIHEKGDILTIYAIVPILVPDEKKPVIYDFLHRANYDLMLGNFEIDGRDGEIRYKVSQDFCNTTPSLEILDRMIDCALSMVDRYNEGIGAILFGNVSAEEAIEIIESDLGPREERSSIVQ